MSANEQDTYDKVKRYIDFKRLSRHLNTENNESLKSPRFLDLEPRFESNYRLASLTGLGAGLLSFLSVNSIFNRIKYKPIRLLNSFKAISVVTACMFAMRVWKVMILQGYNDLKKDIDRVLKDPVYVKWLYPTRNDLIAIRRDADADPNTDGDSD